MKRYISENVIEEFYKAIADEDEKFLAHVHIPRSDVFYVRRAYYETTGNWETLDRIERAMYLEGYLAASDVFEPRTKREWG